MSDNKTYERLHAALKDIKESNDAIYAALVAILAHLMADEGGLPKKDNLMKDKTRDALERGIFSYSGSDLFPWRAYCG